MAGGKRSPLRLEYPKAGSDVVRTRRSTPALPRCKKQFGRVCLPLWSERSRVSTSAAVGVQWDHAYVYTGCAPRAAATEGCGTAGLLSGKRGLLRWPTPTNSRFWCHAKIPHQRH